MNHSILCTFTVTLNSPGSNFGGNNGGVSGHTQSLTGLLGH